MEAHVDTSEARAHLNYLLTLGLRREEAFGPMALNFIKDCLLYTSDAADE